MKKISTFFISIFLLMNVQSYCLAVSPIKTDAHTGEHDGQVAEDFELSGKLENGIRVVEVKASRYKFEPDLIVVKLGEKVRLFVTSMDVAHGLAISEFKVNLSVSAGKTETTEFVADKKGTFHAYCSVYCGPGHAQMHASFIVK